jgi:hypothetical protein
MQLPVITRLHGSILSVSGEKFSPSKCGSLPGSQGGFFPANGHLFFAVPLHFLVKRLNPLTHS